MTKSPYVLEIKGNSLDDGPGIRSVVFFKGCPLSCIWCHNPESKKATAEISFDANECIGCNTCINTCTCNALSKNNPFFIDRKKCTLCFDCVETCPAGALVQVGRDLGITGIVEEVMKDKSFFDASKGGITFSGGEPTLYMEFLAEAAKALKAKGVHVLIETCGQFHYQTFSDLVYAHVDLIYFDIKIMEGKTHEKYCGLSNTAILDNFRTLYRKYLDGGVEIMPRTPMVPGITDTEENLSAILSLYKEEKVNKTQLLAYHPLWRDKNRKLGIRSPQETGAGMGEWMAKERLRACEKMFTDAGIVIEH